MPVWPQGHGWAQVPWLKAAFFLFLFLFSPKESCLLEGKVGLKPNQGSTHPSPAVAPF